MSMVCLESAILEAPSMFKPHIMNDATNQFKRYIDISPLAGTEDNILDYWRDKTTSLNYGVTNSQTNN